jgi:regulation of enolase protein 1 (concanavalin A-like superfamily)
VWGTADALQYAYVPLSGDGSITARVVSLTGSQAWVKVGVMIRGSTSPGSAQAFMLVSKSKGLAFQRRLSDGATSLSTAGPAGTAPKWVRLTRTGNTITASSSTDGTTWTVVGSDTFSMPANALIGLATSSHSASELATGVLDNVTISSATPTPPSALPPGWAARDIGAVGTAGSSSASDGTFTVTGAGSDVWGTADAFQYAYMPLSGDGSITARVASLTGSQAWVKVGVMIRGTTSPGSSQAFMLVSKSKGLAFQRRLSDGAASVSTAGPTSTAPAWVRLERTGNTITASTSTNGTAWTVVGSDTFSMPANALIGLATSSHSASELSSGVLDNVTISSASPTL